MPSKRKPPVLPPNITMHNGKRPYKYHVKDKHDYHKPTETMTTAELLQFIHSHACDRNYHYRIDPWHCDTIIHLTKNYYKPDSYTLRIDTRNDLTPAKEQPKWNDYPLADILALLDLQPEPEPATDTKPQLQMTPLFQPKGTDQ